MTPECTTYLLGKRGMALGNIPSTHNVTGKISRAHGCSQQGPTQTACCGQNQGQKMMYTFQGHHSSLRAEILQKLETKQKPILSISGGLWGFQTSTDAQRRVPFPRNTRFQTHWWLAARRKRRHRTKAAWKRALWPRVSCVS